MELPPEGFKPSASAIPPPGPSGRVTLLRPSGDDPPGYHRGSGVDGPVDPVSLHVEVGDRSDPLADRRHDHAPFGQALTQGGGGEPGGGGVDVQDVGLRGGGGTDAEQAEALGEPGGGGVVVGQSVDVVIEG